MRPAPPRWPNARDGQPSDVLVGNHKTVVYAVGSIAATYWLPQPDEECVGALSNKEVVSEAEIDLRPTTS